MSDDGATTPLGGGSPGLEVGQGGRDQLDVVRRLGRSHGLDDVGVSVQGQGDDVGGGPSDGDAVDPGVLVEGPPGVDVEGGPELLTPLEAAPSPVAL